MSEIRVGIIGLGFMGRTHLSAYRSAAAAGVSCRVTAVMDPAAGHASGGGNLSTGADKVDLSGVRIFTSAEAFFREAEVDAVSLCTPTDTHADLARLAMERGYHLLIEKPVARTSAEIARVLAARGDRVCMPAMVMRFWPGWAWLRERVRESTYGALESLTCQRMGSGPTWNAEFYRNFARSGGALVDLHIHDTDFVYWLLGKPASVVSQGTLERVSTMYRFAGGAVKRATAEGGWMSPGFAFVMRYVAQFERATVVFDLSGGAEPVTVFADGNASKPALPTISGYEAEVRHFLDAVAAARAGRAFTLAATLEDAAVVAEILAAEKRSIETGREVAL